MPAATPIVTRPSSPIHRLSNAYFRKKAVANRIRATAAQPSHRRPIIDSSSAASIRRVGCGSTAGAGVDGAGCRGGTGGAEVGGGIGGPGATGGCGGVGATVVCDGAGGGAGGFAAGEASAASNLATRAVSCCTTAERSLGDGPPLRCGAAWFRFRRVRIETTSAIIGN